MEFIPSIYQQKIFDFITKGYGSAVINAKAGSGKTTTIVEAMKLINNDKKVLYIAFNKSIEEELSKKLKEYTNVTVKTYHSLGREILNYHLKEYKKIKYVNEYKYISYINRNVLNFLPEGISLNDNDLFLYKNNIKMIVDFARFNYAQSLIEMKNICKKYDITPLFNECDVAIKVLKWGESVNEIDFTDMVWLCVEKDIKINMYNNYFKFDFIFIDEAQDSSIIQQKLIEKCYKRGTRFIAIGDEYQCINAFAGADHEAFSKFQSGNVTKLELPVTYRCPKKIVEYIRNNIKDIDIQCADNAIEGEINYNVSPNAPQDKDMVLCRNSVQLVKLYMYYNKINKKSYIKGREIGKNLLKLLDSVDKENLAITMESDGVFPRLYEQLFNKINHEIEINNIEYKDIINISSIIDIIDSIKALEVLSEGLQNKTKKELKEKIECIFGDIMSKTNEEDIKILEEDGVCLSTIHKAKGLETDNVYILCPSLMPSKHAKKEWEIKSEENLIYVAMTRCKKSLNYISEEKFPPFLFKDKNIINNLEKQKKIINNILNIEL